MVSPKIPKYFKNLDFEQTRNQFHALKLMNPNFFGTLKESKFEPVKPIQNNTDYEELKCIGFNPQFDRLEAVVSIKRETGYGGGICSKGTPQYVRFFLSKDDGLTWIDQGITSFRSYDIPGKKPLEYIATKIISPEKKFCSSENIVKVRAILSWNDKPDGPDFIPIWGNSLESYIQIDKKQVIVLAELLKTYHADLFKEVENFLDMDQVLISKEAKPVKMNVIAEKYIANDVPKHRLLYKQLKQELINSKTSKTWLNSALIDAYPDIKIDLGEVLENLYKTDGNIDYEEMKCVGLNQENDTLVATIHLKRTLGYSGDLCSSGSLEYVAFWEYDEIEQMWLYLGRASVRVYDLSIPPEGLQYSIFLPADLRHHHRPCSEGPRVVRIRAILSWEQMPPDDDPDWIPTFGNREEVLIHVAPGKSVNPGDHRPFVETVAGMSVSDIDIKGLAKYGEEASGTASFMAVDSPFGGVVRVTGRLLNPTDSYTSTEKPLQYKIQVRQADVGETWQDLNNAFNVSLATLQGGLYSYPFKKKQEFIDEHGYEYLEDYTGPDKRFYVIPILAEWHTAGKTGLWEMRIDAYNPNDYTAWPGTQIIKIKLDQSAPELNLTITGYIRGSAPEKPAKPCDKFKIGDTIIGSFSAIDDDYHFYKFTLSVNPGGSGFPSFGAVPNPNIKVYPAADTHGESGKWELNTAGMAACGYTLRLWAEDRTIVNGGSIGWENSTSVGFCLEN